MNICVLRSGPSTVFLCHINYNLIDSLADKWPLSMLLFCEHTSLTYSHSMGIYIYIVISVDLLFIQFQLTGMYHWSQFKLMGIYYWSLTLNSRSYITDHLIAVQWHISQFILEYTIILALLSRLWVIIRIFMVRKPF